MADRITMTHATTGGVYRARPEQQAVLQASGWVVDPDATPAPTPGSEHVTHDQLAALAPQHQLVAWDTFERADGAPGTAQSGQVYATTGNVAVPRISSGKLVANADGTAFVQIDTVTAAYEIGCTYTIQPGTVGSSLMLGSSNEGDLSISDQIHFITKLDGWTFQVVQSSDGLFQALASGTWDAPLTADGATEYSTSLTFEGSSCHVRLADGSVVTVTDARIAALHGRYAIWEPTRNVAAGYAEPRITALWAVRRDTTKAASPFATPGSIAKLVGRFLRSGGELVAKYGATTQASIGQDPATGFAALMLGSARDAVLYRGAANDLRTAGTFRVSAGAANQVIVGSVSGGAGLSLGVAGDTLIRRVLANVIALGADDVLICGKNVTGSRPSAVTVTAGAQFYDTTLSKPIWSDGTVWRDAAGTAV